jgi:hypothetical protein
VGAAPGVAGVSGIATRVEAAWLVGAAPLTAAGQGCRAGALGAVGRGGAPDCVRADGGRPASPARDVHLAGSNAA